MVCRLDPKETASKINTFEEYASMVIIPHILMELRTARPVDIVLDNYKKANLKSALRQCCDEGKPIW